MLVVGGISRRLMLVNLVLGLLRTCNIDEVVIVVTCIFPHFFDHLGLNELMGEFVFSFGQAAIASINKTISLWELEKSVLNTEEEGG